jgi:hypothetical protein
MGQGMKDRNQPCPCGSGKKRKKCCRDLPMVRGAFDPDLPISTVGGQVGNHRQAGGSWYVIRAGHGHPRTPALTGERLARARSMIAKHDAELREAKLAELRAGGGALGTLAAVAAWSVR